MAEYTEDQLEAMSDEELEAAANEARLAENNEPQDDTDENDNISDNEPENVDDGSDVDTDVSDTNVGDNEDVNTEEPDDGVEDEKQETSNEEPDNDDGQSGSEDDDTNNETSDAPTQEFQPLKVKGKYIPINSMEELYTLASGGAAVTQSFQEIAGHKKSINIMQEHGLTEADLSLLVEARNGSKDALASLVKQSGIDYLDMTDEVSEGYQPGKYIPDDTTLNLKEVQREISVDPEYEITQNIVNNFMDERSQEAMVQNPNLIRGIHEDIKSGAYELVSAHAEKLKLMDGGRKPFMEYYIQAAQIGPENEPMQEQQTMVPQQQAPLNNQQPQKKVVDKSKKRSASSNRQKSAPASIKDINDMTDEELMAYREKIMERF